MQISKKLFLGIISGALLAAIAFLAVGISNSQNSATSLTANAISQATGEVQSISIKALSTGSYDKNEIKVRAGAPIQLKFSAEKNSGCGKQLVIPTAKIFIQSLQGEERTATFTISKPGTYSYQCPMGMFKGKLIAV